MQDSRSALYRIVSKAPFDPSVADDTARVLRHASEPGFEPGFSTTARPRSYTPCDLVVLVDRERGDHPFGEDVDWLVDRWRANGLMIQRYDYAYRPWYLMPELGGDAVTLGDLAHRVAGRPLIVISRMLGAVDGAGHVGWLGQLVHWPVRVHLDPDPRARDERTDLVTRALQASFQAGLPRFALDAGGVLGAAHRLIGMRVAVASGCDAAPLAPLTEVSAAIATWARCAAFAPVRTWAGIQALRRAIPELAAALPHAGYVQRLVEWLWRCDPKSDPLGRHGGWLHLSEPLAARLRDEQRRRDRALPVAGKLENQCHRFFLAELRRARPRTAIEAGRRLVEMAWHQSVLDGRSPDRALARFAATPLEAAARAMLAPRPAVRPAPSRRATPLAFESTPRPAHGSPLRHRVTAWRHRVTTWRDRLMTWRDRVQDTAWANAGYRAMSRILARNRGLAGVAAAVALIAAVSWAAHLAPEAGSAHAASETPYLAEATSGSRSTSRSASVPTSAVPRRSSPAPASLRDSLSSSLTLLTSSLMRSLTAAAPHDEAPDAETGGDLAFSGVRQVVPYLAPRAPSGKIRSRATGSSWGITHIALQEDAPMRFVGLTGGEFTMGSSRRERGRDKDEGPRRRIHLSPFEIAETEVTQGQWTRIMSANPSACEIGCGDTLPVNNVTWNQAVEFANRLSGHEGLTPCYDRGRRAPRCTGYRLPTEAEWEYAARAGSRKRFGFGDDVELLDDHAWYNDYAIDAQVKPVASKLANRWGLHDMHGNVWEWTEDWYGPYPENDEVDPSGPARGAHRVMRGGSFVYTARFLRVANRKAGNPIFRPGLRLVRSRVLALPGPRARASR